MTSIVSTKKEYDQYVKDFVEEFFSCEKFVRGFEELLSEDARVVYDDGEINPHYNEDERLATLWCEHEYIGAEDEETVEGRDTTTWAGAEFCLTINSPIAPYPIMTAPLHIDAVGNRLTDFYDYINALNMGFKKILKDKELYFEHDYDHEASNFLT